MSVKYYLQPYTLSQEKNANRARVIVNDAHGIDGIVEKMGQRGTTFGTAELKGFMALLNQVIQDELAKGNTVNLPFVKIRPAIKGIFNGATDKFDPARHKITLNYWNGILSDHIASSITLEKVVKPLPAPEISFVTDSQTGLSNAVLSIGGIAKITGKQLDFNGDDPNEGIYLIDSTGTESKLELIAHKTRNNLVFGIPPLLAAGAYLLEVRKKYGKSGNLRKGRTTVQLAISV